MGCDDDSDIDAVDVSLSDVVRGTVTVSVVVDMAL